MRIFATLFLLLLLGSCGDAGTPYQTRPPKDGEIDWCGYTWRKTAPASTVISFREVTSWEQMPGTCARPGTQGCAESIGYANGERITVIWLLTSVDAAAADRGQCNVLTHELLHAQGYSHAEAHSYAPRDFTR